MNAKKLIYAAMAVLSAGALNSCSSDYLELAPQTSVTNADAISTVNGARLAMIGVCQAMWQQYQDIGDSNGYNFMNGEAYIGHRMNDAFGPDSHVGIAMQMWGYEILTGQSPWHKDNYVMNVIIWKYCYNLIQQANTVLSGIDGAAGSDTERAFVKAQLLTLRAHGYTKLMEYYAPRWENSRNGEAMCAVKRIEGGVEDAPLCSMKEVFDIIYSDLREAIDLYKESGLTRDASEKWQPDLSVAYGVFARAAMIIHDWKTAQEMAHNAWQGYKVMDNDTYLAGFYRDNDDFMWTTSGDEVDIYYWSEYCMFAPNGNYTAKWMYPDGIDMDLYRQMDPNDIRRQCYMTPDKIAVVEGQSKSWNPGKVKEADFWDSSLVNESALLDLSYGPYVKDKNDASKKWGLYNVALYYSYYYTKNIFKGNLQQIVNRDSEAGDLFGYYYSSPKGPVRLDKTSYGTLNRIPFGAQFKFWSIAPYATGTFPFMRATEMKLLEAEAACMQNDASTALAILKEINGMRIPGYSINGSGSALLDEVRLCRRIELWGEGHNWTDFKRWNLPIVRRAWVPNDPTSGNWVSEFAVETPVAANGGWRMLVPRSEIEFNKAIDRTLVESNE